ncbi:MAG: hypothetical protein ACTSWA_02515 [Candidatus Thorarchaeota archaeon]
MYKLGDIMLRNDRLEQETDDKESFLFPDFNFAVFPAILSLVGALILTQLLRLIGAYNYLRGSSSPIDQSALALLGSDLTRIAVMISCILGIGIGLYLFRFVTTKLDVVRKEGETVIGVRMYIALNFLWILLILPIQLIWFLEVIIYGPYNTSHFLFDISSFTMAGFYVAFAIPVLMQYVRLVLHARSIDSRVKLIEHRSGNGLIKLKYLTLKVIRDGPDP